MFLSCLGYSFLFLNGLYAQSRSDETDKSLSILVLGRFLGLPILVAVKPHDGLETPSWNDTSSETGPLRGRRSLRIPIARHKTEPERLSTTQTATDSDHRFYIRTISA